MRAKLRIISQIVFSLHFLGILGASAQDQSNDYSGLRLKLICPKREIVAGQNFGFQVVMSNSAQRIGIVQPMFMVTFDLVIQKDGKTLRYSVTKCPIMINPYSQPDLEIEANGIWAGDEDLYEGYPFGIGEGNFTLFATYSPSKTNRDFKIWSNPIQLAVLRRSPEHEEQYNYYESLCRPSREEEHIQRIQQALQFLATYINSPFEPRIRLMLVRLCIHHGDYALARKMMEIMPLLPTATKREIASMHYSFAGALKEQGYLYEAFAELETSPIPFPDHEIKTWKRELAMLHLPAQVRLEPEALKVSPGILTAHVRLPECFPVSGITTATCDHAAAERMILSDDGTEMIMEFRRQDIEAAQARIGKNIDTNFVVQGNWTGTVVTARGTRTSSYFWGTASIMKIVKEETQDKTRDKDENKDTDKEKNKGK